jgi:hypothetical protein
MEYAARLPSIRSMAVPVVALTIGAAGAVGIYAALDDADTSAQSTRAQSTRVIVADPPVTGEGTAAKDEAATAAAVGGSTPLPSNEIKDEAAIAAAVGDAQAQQAHKGGGPPAEDDVGTANRTDPHGPAATTP